jgi:RNA polymerase sigma factor (sigma-70 family)
MAEDRMRAVERQAAAGDQVRPAPQRVRERPAREDAEPAVVELLRRHAGRLMAVARRHSASREDAEDAYQRAVEILLTRAPSTDPAELLPWVKTVVKHEAFAVGHQRARHGTPSEVEHIEPLAGLATGPAELAERRDRLRLGAEALGRLKPQEVRALLLRAEGLSYREICAATGWSYTKVNRCLSEGRQRFVERVAGIEGGDECVRLAPLVSALADGEASQEDLVALRPHLRGCLACRARLREYRRAPERAAAAVLPVGAIASLWGSLRGAAHAVSARVHEAGVVQSAAAHKVAAVAASTVVLAGGGAATVGVLGGDAHPAQDAPARRVSPIGPSGSAPAARPHASAGARGWRSGRPSARRGWRPAGSAAPRAPRSAARRPRFSPSAPTSGEFTPTAAPTGAPAGPAPPPAPAPRPTAAPGPGGGEFAP